MLIYFGNYRVDQRQIFFGFIPDKGFNNRI